MLLLRHGGPIESLDELTQRSRVGTEMVVVAVETDRAPVFLRTKEQHNASTTRGASTVAFFTVEEGDIGWLRALQVRRGNGSLKEGGDARNLMTKREVSVEDGVEWLTKMGLQ